MDTIILTCGSLLGYVKAAQKKAGTRYPVIVLNKKYHADPELMKVHIIKKLNHLPKHVKTVLVAMGYCGGSWENISINKRLVIPRVDECVSLLLHRDDEYHPDLKQKGYLYMKDKDPKQFSIASLFESFTKGMAAEEKQRLKQSWVAAYDHVAVVDTGLYNCYAGSYVKEAAKNAEWIEGDVRFIYGSNIIIEKLIEGRWDQQFIVAEPNQLIKKEMF